MTYLDTGMLDCNWGHHGADVMKIIVADDHALFREGLKQILLGLGEDVSVLEANSHETVLELLSANPDADLALIDLHMPGREDLTGLIEVLDHARTIPVVVLSGSEEMGEIQQVVRMGVMGYIPKYEHADVMICALRLVLSGSVYVPPMLLSSVTSNQPFRSQLTSRQIDVLQQLCDGYSNKEIARKLNLSEATVKSHASSIFRELQVNNRLQAATVAKKLGLIN